MKVFRCGDVVPGCTTELRGDDEEAVLEAVERHARAQHGVAPDAELVGAVRDRVREG
ncbi:DUF1059 domain-containing protein [uncultured Pseudokineococcus sp.]|uniref:DUF1059 domain-containing protein n=1 Tax=uncultured Pseudokineococcus sp. TaxID=1642928 RepID=UPI002636CB5D|nr:DUF1059 domain-containing protein [uncultured Pseudokineococcus sp.]